MARFEAATEAFAPSAAFWLSDIALLGYFHELLDSARATAALVDARPALHCVPLARAAFEAAQSVLLLTTAEDYAYAGALAYVYGLRKDHDITIAHASDLSHLEPTEGGPGWLDHAVREVADTWEDLWPGRRTVVSKAAAELNGRWGKRPDNWAGVNPATELNRRLPLLGTAAPQSGGDIATVFRNAYRSLNRDTHPRTVVRPSRLERREDGTISTELEYRDLAGLASSAIDTVAGALNLGILGRHFRGQKAEA